MSVRILDVKRARGPIGDWDAAFAEPVLRRGKVR